MEEILQLRDEHTGFRTKYQVDVEINNIKIHIEMLSGAAVTLMSIFQLKRIFSILKSIVLI